MTFVILQDYDHEYDVEYAEEEFYADQFYNQVPPF